MDPDGAGPLGHAAVYCNMTGECTGTSARASTPHVLVCICVCVCVEDKVWTVMDHNNPQPVSVQGSSARQPHVAKLNYSATLRQLHTLLHRAQHCQQEVVYRCRKSRLFNTWGNGRGPVITQLTFRMSLIYLLGSVNPGCR